MEIPSLKSVQLLYALLPGLLVFVILRTLTSRDKRLDATEAVLYGLAYTLICNAIVFTVTHYYPVVKEVPEVALLSTVAVVFAFVLSIEKNNAFFFRILQTLRITRENAWPSVWETVFRECRRNKSEFICVTMKDGTRVQGAIRHNTDDPTAAGHIALENAHWLDASNKLSPRISGLIVISVTEIQHLIFCRRENDPNIFQRITRWFKRTDSRRSAVATATVSESIGASPDYTALPSTSTIATPTPTTTSTTVQELIKEDTNG